MTDQQPIDPTTDAGYKRIEFVSAKGIRDHREVWHCYPILHDGDGPLGERMRVIPSIFGSKFLIAKDAAEQAAMRLYDNGDLNDGERMTIKVAVHLTGNQYAAFGVVVTLEPQFEAKEL